MAWRQMSTTSSMIKEDESIDHIIYCVLHILKAGLVECARSPRKANTTGYCIVDCGNGCGDLEWSSEARRQHLVRSSVRGTTLEGAERPLEVAHALGTIKHVLTDQWV